MIPFEMKILSYNNATYTVEYIPKNEKCTPVKLSIKLDSAALTTKANVLDALKKSSPQDHWESEVSTSSIDHSVLASLVNTSHAVGEITLTSGTGNSTPTSSYNIQRNTFTAIDVNRVENSVSSRPTPTNSTPINLSSGADPTVGSSTPEQVVSGNEQSVIKLKILIQQVLQEMAEGTV
jgi:hypothetical protein